MEEQIDQHAKLTMQIYMGQGVPGVEINNMIDSVPLYMFRNSPMFAELSPEQATTWAAQLRLMAEQFERWAAEMQPAICFPTMGMEDSN